MKQIEKKPERECIHCGKVVSKEDNFEYGVFNDPMHKECVGSYNANLMSESTEDEEVSVDYHQKAQSREEFNYYKENGWC